MNYYSLLFHPRWNDFTILHYNKKYYCNSYILKSISPVIRNCKSNQFTLPNFPGSIETVFSKIFDPKIEIDENLLKLFWGTVVKLDIKCFVDKFEEFLFTKYSPKEIYQLAIDFSSHDVDVKCFVPIIALNFDIYFYFFGNSKYENILLSKVFEYHCFCSSNPSILVNLLIEKFNNNNELFNNAVTSFMRTHMTQNTIGILSKLPDYDMNQIKDSLHEFILNLNQKKSIPCLFPSINYTFLKTQGKPGVFSYIFANNPNDLLPIKITYSPHENGNIDNILNLIQSDSQNEKPYIQLKNSSDLWFCFSLLKNSLTPTAYVIKSWENASTSTPISWKLEGSNDEINWTLLNEVQNCSDLKCNNFIKAVHLDNIKMRFKHFKLTQLSGSVPNEFCLSKFDMFGVLYSD